MKRLLKWLLVGILALLLLVVLPIAVLVASEGGSRWLLEHIPGLQVDSFDGRLGNSWQAKQLHWQSGELSVQLTEPVMDWSPGCLWRMTLCVGRLSVQRIDLHLPPSEPPAEETPFTLPDISLPVDIQLGEVALGELYLNDSLLLSDLQLKADWHDGGIDSATGSVKAADSTLQINQLNLKTTGDWPVRLDALVTLPEVDEKPWQIALQVAGEAQKTLDLTGQSTGYLEAELKGWVNALAEDLPAELAIHSQQFKASAELPDTLTFKQLLLTAKGTLTEGYQLQGQGDFAAAEGDMPLALAGLVKATGAKLDGLSIKGSDQEYVQISGELDWQDVLAGDLKLDWQAFPWQRLYPLDEPVAVNVQRLQTEVKLNDNRYLGNLSGQFDGPAGAFSLLTPFSGDFESISLPQLELVAGKGRLTGLVDVGFADAITWRADLKMSDFDPAILLAEMPGSLAGPIRSEGSLANGQLNVQADVDLNGRLRGQSSRVLVKADGAGERWNVPQLLLSLGDNKVSGQANLNERIQGALQLDLPRLAQLWPGLQGQLAGQLNLAGTLQAPQGNLTLNGQRIRFEDTGLAQLTANASLNASQQGQLAVQVRGLRQGETMLGQLVINGQGTEQRHNLDMSLKGPQLQLATALNGSLDAQRDWSGQLTQLDIGSGGQNWRLQKATQLNYRHTGELTIAAHCLASGNASLCGKSQRLMPELAVDYQLRNFPMSSLQPLFPEDFNWEGVLNGDIQLAMPASGSNGKIVLDAGSGRFRVRNPDQTQWQDFVYNRLKVEATLRPDRVDSLLSLQGPALGELALQARINPHTQAKALSGNLQLTGLDLAVLAPFVPQLDTLSGQLSGQARLGGGLLKPVINGEFRLSDGHIAGTELPVSFEQLQVRLAIDGDRGQLDGNWNSGDQGRGQLAGQFNWARALQAEVTLKGQALPLTVEPYAAMEFEPDLRLTVAGEKIAVTGKVLVPRGNIKVRELPPSTVQVSSDARIIGRDTRAEEASAAPNMEMDVVVEVGSDRVRFDAFGLTADITGHLNIGDNLDTRGDLELVNGRFRAYGQRLTLRRARILFTGPIDQPFLDVEAIRTVDSVVAGLRLSGSAEQPEATLFSEPLMDQDQVLSYLILGRPMNQGGGDNNMLGQAALALGLAGTSSFTGSLAERLGIRDFELDSEGSGDSTSVVASGYLTDKLSVRYGVGVFEPANTLALRYDLSKRVYLEAASGLASSLDIFYKRDF